MGSFRQPVDVVQGARRNPVAFGHALHKALAERHLIDFVRLMWKVLDPGTPLRIGWAMEAICEHLEAVSNGQIRNLLINVPPGFSKSLCTDTFWPMWEWGPRNRPDLRYLSWSYAEKLTKINNTKARNVLRSPIFRALWGDRVKISKDQDEKLHFANTAGGFKLASSIGGVGTGLRGDRLILDDPHSVDGADSEAIREGTISWFGGTMTTRVRNANDNREYIDGMWVDPSAVVIIMQRVHRRDISGVILDEGLGFEHLLIEMEYEGTSHPARRTVGWRASTIGYTDPRERMITEIRATRESFRQAAGATLAGVGDPWSAFCELWTNIAEENARLADPGRFNRVAIESAKKKLRLKSGSNAVAAQYRQWPHEGTGVLFKREWFKYVDAIDVPNAGRDDCRGWDMAATEDGGDATATVKLRMSADGRIFVMDARAARLSPAKVEDMIRATATADGHQVLQSFPQDPGSAGKHLINHLSRNVLQGFRFRSSPEMKDKATRATPFASQVEHGNVYLVRGTWNSAFVSELEEFPHGLHDDLVDATSRAYDALLNAMAASEPVAPKVFIRRF